MRRYRKKLTVKAKSTILKYHLGKVEKSQEEFDEVQKLLLEKINTLLQKED
jgi:hypothetical protein